MSKWAEPAIARRPTTAPWAGQATPFVRHRKAAGFSPRRPIKPTPSAIHLLNPPIGRRGIQLAVSNQDDPLPVEQRKPSALEETMLTYHAYAAPSAKAPLGPFSFDPGPLGPGEVEIKAAYCGLCHSDLPLLDDEWPATASCSRTNPEAKALAAAIGQSIRVRVSAERLFLN